MSYSTSLQNTALPAIIAMAKRDDDSLTSLKPVPQYIELVLNLLGVNSEVTINWSNIGNSQGNNILTFKLYRGTTLINILSLIPGDPLTAALLKARPLIVLPNTILTVTAGYALTRLALIVEPVLLIESIVVN
jgi:hypothetical protein